MIHDQVIAFIAKFASARDCFLNGCCYWFATLLRVRFSLFVDCELMYHMVDNHFAVMIDGVLYDVTGRIPATGFIPWRDVEHIDSLLYSRIVRDCVLMEDENGE